MKHQEGAAAQCNYFGFLLLTERVAFISLLLASCFYLYILKLFLLYSSIDYRFLTVAAFPLRLVLPQAQPREKKKRSFHT